ncbi:hypothetical protein PVAND_012635 [Polypedilum vanderplanki]|uniref:VWFC domain-containing protein n=1 Tax=Polypedilum vanderplanki TaxID=319348 RepID=A0A9J6CN07_POLVA|nr:hypothetical protein PVAND_012635 [Polypedilum vanderplanki]
MNWFFYVIILLYLLVQFSYSTPQHNNHRNGYAIGVDKGMAMGCLHNSTMFADTSIVPTSEPCLVCKCSKRNLLCVRRVCKDQPYPPPRGCILVYKKTLCCPYLSCSKYHVNYYKNSERNRENNFHQITQEKVSEKRYRTDDEAEEMNGGCIESGSLYASGSAMYRSSSSSTCTYCYCINGQQKCIKPKCMLKNTKCKPIFMEASCCPIKYDCNNNSNSSAIAISNKHQQQQQQYGSVNKFALVKRKNRSNGCVVGEKQFHEGERLPHDDERPCEVCYCIKGMRKCTIKKCAPVIRGCVPKIPITGSCCPTSYDCRRSIKFKRESRQENENEEEEDETEEEDSDTIDFFSLLFGSDEPKEKEETMTPIATTTTAPPPFKALPPSSSSTESSFFDLIRAGLEMIDANADKIDTHLNSIVPSTPETTTEKVLTETSTTEGKSLVTTTASVNEMTKGLPSMTTTEKESFSVKSTSTLPMKSESDEKTTTMPTMVTKSLTMKMAPAATKATTTRTLTTPSTTIKSTTKSSTAASSSQTLTITTTKLSTASAKVNSIITTSSMRPLTTTSSKIATTTRRILSETSKRATTKRPTTTTTVRTTSSKKYIVPSVLQHQRIPVQFNADVLPDTKLVVSSGSDENEADTLPNLEIIPFVAHDAIKTDKYEPYRPSPSAAASSAILPSYDNLEKDYFAATDKEKPFRYNNKFIHHNYDDTLDYVHTNPHDRIDNGPYYYETNENQFDAFSPPNEQDFLGGFSPKESIFDEVPSSTSVSFELPLKHNDYAQKPLDTTTVAAAPIAYENKSNLTTMEKKNVVTLAINQTNEHKHHEQSTVPNFKKISTNFTSFIDDLLQANVLDESMTTKITTKAPLATATHSSTSAPIKSIINDDDFIIKHLRVSTTTMASTTVKREPGLMEIFSKPSKPTMNGLLKLAGCNIYGQMYEVGQVIEELSNRCLECKCLPDIGVGCVPKC